MKKISLIYLLCICFYTINAQNSNDIVIGKIESIHSNILNEERKIWIHVPEENPEGLYEKKNYPVVYLLDGDSHFDSVVGMLRQLSSVNGNGICPKMIVVGIPNTNRMRDLTPTKGKPKVGEDTGGGENFMSFIQKELIPYINSNYPTQPYKMLIGHSLGGLTVMNTLVHKPNLFDAYVAIDPSMWWNERALLNTIKQTNFDKKYSKKSLYLGIANTMNPGMDIKNVLKDTTSQTEHIRSILELNTFLNGSTQKELSYKGKYYEEDDHGSVPLITEYDAIRFIFDFYRLKLENQDFSDPESNFINKIVNHYKRLSEVFKIEMKPDEEYINNLGYQFMGMQQLKKSEDLLKLNVTNYPESWNAYDSYGEILLKLNKKEQSLEMYKKSIALNPNNEDGKKIIKEIEL
ncbi:MAG: alpha/beta hydrolase [Flavobacteriaceae bacterium]|nr:alpha/beta hydrolase [Flavobacteriaceae bacterium]